MKSVFKYPLQVETVQELSLPFAAEIRAIQVQHNMPQLWAEIETNTTERETRTFYTAGTGHVLPCDEQQPVYLGTYQLKGGALVFHVYEVLKP